MVHVPHRKIVQAECRWSAGVGHEATCHGARSGPNMFRKRTPLPWRPLSKRPYGFTEQLALLEFASCLWCKIRIRRMLEGRSHCERRVSVKVCRRDGDGKLPHESTSRNVDPLPSSLSASIRPPMASAALAAMDRPRPAWAIPVSPS